MGAFASTFTDVSSGLLWAGTRGGGRAIHRMGSRGVSTSFRSAVPPGYA